MSFATDIDYLMTNDSSLNGYCNGGINYENLPENFDLTKNWIVYSFNKSTQATFMGCDGTLTTYNLTVKAISKSTVDAETISDYVVSYLNGNSYGNIGYIYFVSDSHALDFDKNIYMNTMQFDCMYS
jgi:hypothetical protein